MWYRKIPAVMYPVTLCSSCPFFTRSHPRQNQPKDGPTNQMQTQHSGNCSQVARTTSEELCQDFCCCLLQFKKKKKKNLNKETEGKSLWLKMFGALHFLHFCKIQWQINWNETQLSMVSFEISDPCCPQTCCFISQYLYCGLMGSHNLCPACIRQ